nr:protein phosphatase 2C domain-containing protein [Streptomyces sp. SAJ15]
MGPGQAVPPAPPAAGSRLPRPRVSGDAMEAGATGPGAAAPTVPAEGATRRGGPLGAPPPAIVPTAPPPAGPPAGPSAPASPSPSSPPSPAAAGADRVPARVEHVGDGPPTYDPEPTALPLANPADLDDLVPDTVLDGASYGSLTLRAVSLRGDSARYRGEPRRDALLTARFGAGERALVLVAVASGVRAAAGAHRAARDMCACIGRAVGRSHARLAEDVRSGRRAALKSGLHRLTDRSLGQLRARAGELGVDPGEYTASLRCLLLPADPGCRTRVYFGVGDGGLFLLRDGAWRDLDAAAAPHPPRPPAPPPYAPPAPSGAAPPDAARGAAAPPGGYSPSGGYRPPEGVPGLPGPEWPPDPRRAAVFGTAPPAAPGPLGPPGQPGPPGGPEPSARSASAAGPVWEPDAPATGGREPGARTSPFRFHAALARPGDTLLLCSAGLADPLRGEPALAERLGRSWAAGEPPGLAAFLADAQVRVKGYADDRTAAAVWEA